MKKLSLFLAIVMTLSFCLSSCSTKASSGTKTSSSTSSPYICKMIYMNVGTEPKDLKKVEDEINKITVKKINVKVSFVSVSVSTLTQQMSLMISSGEQLDLAPYLPAINTNAIAQGQFIDMSSLIDKYGSGIKKSLDNDFLKCGMVNGKLYSVATVRDLAQTCSVFMRKDLVQKYNINLDNIKTLNDLSDVFKKVKAGETNMTMMVPQDKSSPIAESYVDWDNLGDNFGVIMDKGQSLNVVNLYETSEYKSLVNLMRQWYQAGYISKNCTSTSDNVREIISAGRGFAMMGKSKPGNLQQTSNQCGREMVEKELVNSFATTTTVNNTSWGITVNSKDSGKAMQVLNLMYSDPDVINLLDWGIKGEHYIKVSGSNNVITYPEGVTATNSGYNPNTGWLFGNEELSYIWKGDDPQLWSKMNKFNSSALKSKAMGFVPDETALKTQVSAVTNVYNQYAASLGDGATDPSVGIPKFVSMLKAAGIDQIIKAKQEQLNKWESASNS
jgi:putative aldouronate transport system substrate-binding protein